MRKIRQIKVIRTFVFVFIVTVISCTRTISISDDIYLGMPAEDYYEVVRGDYINVPYIGNGKVKPDFSYSHLVGLEVSNISDDLLDTGIISSVANYFTNKFGRPTEFNLEQTPPLFSPEERNSMKGWGKSLSATWHDHELTVTLYIAQSTTQSTVQTNSKPFGFLNYKIRYTTNYDFQDQFNPNKDKKTHSPSL